VASHPLGFALAQYALLGTWLFGCWGIGRWLLGERLAAPEPTAPGRPSPGLLHPIGDLTGPIATTLGIGIWICVLQVLGIAARLDRAPVLALVATGVGLGAWRLLRDAGRHPPGPAAPPGGSRRWRWRDAWSCGTTAERWTLVAVALLILPTLLAPLAPPMAWDELAYHLPHAREWARTGRLVVSDWLRYPWFPYNFDLLFAVPLLWGDDVLPHLVHAATGWLTAWLIHLLAVRHLRDRVVAGMAAAIWLLLSKGQYDRAYVDMGVTLFATVAFAALHEWRSDAARGRCWLLVCAFCLGIAAGAKYQALALLPFFAFVLALRDRRPSTWLWVAGVLLLPCGYWYARNALLAGDPFSPLGGRWFGFTDWNLADYQGQLADLRDKAGWPDWLLWPALVVPFLPRARRDATVRGLLLASTWMLLVWVASSRYPRYLMTASPLLALLAAIGWARGARALRERFAPLRTPRATRLAGALLMASIGVASIAWSLRHARYIVPEPLAREALLRQRVNGHGMWTWLRDHADGSGIRRVYQLGFEESLYYAPVALLPIHGDAFGPWRYDDLVDLAPRDMHRRLVAQGFDTLVLNAERWPELAPQADFERFFLPLHAEGTARVYRLAPAATSASPMVDHRPPDASRPSLPNDARP